MATLKKQTVLLDIAGQQVRLIYCVDKEFKVRAFRAMAQPHLSTLNALLQRTFGLEPNMLRLIIRDEE